MSLDKHSRPQAPDVARLIAQVYASPNGGAGCCLHVLTDDANYDCAGYVLEIARGMGHPLCIEIAEALVKMKPTGRARACALAHEHTDSVVEPGKETT